MAIQSNLIIDQGSAFTATITVEDETGNTKNLTGYIYSGKIKKSYSSSTSVEFGSSNIDNLYKGELLLTLTDTQTKAMKPGRYVYDAEITDSGGVTTRVVEGQVEVTPGVTLGGT